MSSIRSIKPTPVVPIRSIFVAGFSFHGRMSRGEFFVQTVVSLLLLVVAVPVVLLAMMGLRQMIVGALIVVILLMFLLNQFSATVRRFHDIGQSGWLSLGNFIPGANLAMFFFLVATAGQKGFNRFGFNPVETGPEILKHGRDWESKSDWESAFACYRYVYENDKFGSHTRGLALERIQDLHGQI